VSLVKKIDEIGDLRFERDDTYYISTRKRRDCGIKLSSTNRTSAKMAPPVTSILSGKFVLRSRESEFNPKAVLVVCVRDWRISTTIVDHNMGAHGNSAPPEADLRQAQEIVV
jgi:hypothetical protein